MKWTDQHGMPRATNDEWNAREAATVNALQWARDELGAVSAGIADSAQAQARWSDKDIEPLVRVVRDAAVAFQDLRDPLYRHGPATVRRLFALEVRLRAALARFAEAGAAN